MKRSPDNYVIGPFFLLRINIGLVEVFREEDLACAVLLTDLNLMSGENQDAVAIHDVVGNEIAAYIAGFIIQPVKRLIKGDELNCIIKLIEKLSKGKTLDLSGRKFRYFSGF